MSAFGPKQTSALALHMSAFGGKADMTVCGSPLSRSLLGVERTFLHKALGRNGFLHFLRLEKTPG
jgi:hypothetical protein